MKPAAFMGLLLLVASASNAQLTIQPQIGLDRSTTLININDEGLFKAGNGNSFLKAALRADYKFKGGHGPFITLATNPSPVRFSFSNPSEAKQSYSLSTGAVNLRFEAGYMYTTKPINFKKSSKQVKEAPKKTEAKKSSCGSYYKPPCGSQQKQAIKRTQKNTNLRLQPAVGLAYVPSTPEMMVADAKGYRYNAGNYRTALVTGLGFEFGKGKERILTVGLHYVRGLGKNGTQITTAADNGKLVTNSFQSATSSWGLSLGLPLTIKKSTQNKVRKEQKSSCQPRYQYRSKCVKRI